MLVVQSPSERASSASISLIPFFGAYPTRKFASVLTNQQRRRQPDNLQRLHGDARLVQIRLQVLDSDLFKKRPDLF
jgi:hypothetical protein